MCVCEGGEISQEVRKVRSEKLEGVVVRPSSIKFELSFRSVIKKLSTDEPRLIPRVGAHPYPRKKMFRRPRELPVVVVGKNGGGKKNDGTRDENGEESREQRSKTSRCVLFHRQSTVARSLSPPFQRFSSIFFALDMPFVRVDRYTCKNFPDSFSPPLFSFFFSHIGFGWIITMFFFRSKDIVAITFHFDFERWRDFGEMWVVTILLMFQSVA